MTCIYGALAWRGGEDGGWVLCFRVKSQWGGECMLPNQKKLCPLLHSVLLPLGWLYAAIVLASESGVPGGTVMFVTA